MSMTKSYWRNGILAGLRRRRNRLGRFTLACFALASFTITAAPCFAMASTKANVEHAAHTHDHAEHGHARDHGGSAPAMGHDHDSGARLCPHCALDTALPNHAPSSDHSFCSAYDAPADQTCFSPPTPAKHVVLAPAFEAPPPLVTRPPPRPAAHATGFERSAIALNLRNCVLLI
jgi:hypothetical protein